MIWQTAQLAESPTPRKKRSSLAIATIIIYMKLFRKICRGGPHSLLCLISLSFSFRPPIRVLCRRRAHDVVLFGDSSVRLPTGSYTRAGNPCVARTAACCGRKEAGCRRTHAPVETKVGREEEDAAAHALRGKRQSQDEARPRHAGGVCRGAPGWYAARRANWRSVNRASLFIQLLVNHMCESR